MKFKTRFGKTVEFESKPKVWAPLPDEGFFETATRIYYPAAYRRIKKLKIKTGRGISRKGVVNGNGKE